MIDGPNIKPGAITNTNVNSTAGVEIRKFEKGGSGQMIITDASGTQKYVSMSGDVTIDSEGVATVVSSVGTDSTGTAGPQGPAGATGATGATGPQGPAGPAGSDANVTAANVDNALFGVDTTTFGLVKRTSNDNFAIETVDYPQKYTSTITVGGGSATATTAQTGDASNGYNIYVLNHNLGTSSFIASVLMPYDPSGNSDTVVPTSWQNLINDQTYFQADLGLESMDIVNNGIIIAAVNSSRQLSTTHCAIMIPRDADDSPARDYLVTVIG